MVRLVIASHPDSTLGGGHPPETVNAAAFRRGGGCPSMLPRARCSFGRRCTGALHQDDSGVSGAAGAPAPSVIERGPRKEVERVASFKG